MVDIKQADAMLRIAHRDLKALTGMQDADVFADEIFGFHVQQSVEKCLKAWMCAIGITYPLFYAHQARYEEGYLAADAPLDRDHLIQSVSLLVSLVNTQIKESSQPPAQ